MTCFLLKETHPTSCSDWRYTFCALSEKVVSVLCGVVAWAPTFVVANMMDPARVHFHVDLKISERWDLLDVLLQRQVHYKENFMLLLFAYGDIPYCDGWLHRSWRLVFFCTVEFTISKTCFLLKEACLTSLSD